MAVADRPITEPIAAKASRTPPTLAANPSHNRPRTTAAQEVVIPQVGQRIPHRATSVQGGNPNCWCVPRPRGSGSNKQAITNGTRRYPAVVAAKSRPRGVTSRRESSPVATPGSSDQALAWLQQTGSLALASRKGFTRARFNGGGRIAGSQTRGKVDSGADRPRGQEGRDNGRLHLRVRRSISGDHVRRNKGGPIGAAGGGGVPALIVGQYTARATARTFVLPPPAVATHPDGSEGNGEGGKCGKEGHGWEIGGQADEKNLPVRRSRIGKRRGHVEQNNTWHGQRTRRSACPRLFPILRSRIFVHP